MPIRLRVPGGDVRPMDLEAPAGEKLSSAIWLSGYVPARPMCAGLGVCGQCAARFISTPPEPVEEECKFFSPEELSAGWRLCCRHRVGDEPVELAIQAERQSSPPPVIHPAHGNVYLAIDVGTTSIEWRAQTENGQVAAAGKLFNPQAGAGADIIARLGMAMTPEGLEKLAALLWSALDEIAAVLAASGLDISRACVAANSALTHILLRQPIAGLAHAPYSLGYAGGEIRHIVLNDKNIPCVFPPLPAPFVGGDISAGLILLVRSHVPTPFILADLGTNAELALYTGEQLFLASAPLGPALEGIGPRCGQVAGPTAATAFSLTPRGLSCNPPDALGISATGYLSLLALLLNAGVMEQSGHFREANSAIMPLAASICAKMQNIGGERRLMLSERLYLTADDVEMLLKVKGAFSVALDLLLQTANLKAGNIAALALGGALGEHVSMTVLETLGFIPRVLAAKTRPWGNSSLLGAGILARQPEALAELNSICSHVQILPLAEDPRFMKLYMNAMHWGQDA